ncbi:MAG: ERAP1-like C-terminal domain-containing protein, partial [Nocardioidaceae bacterium]
YMGHRVTADVTAFKDNWLEFALTRKAWGVAADQRASTHPVAGNGAPDADSALNDFDGISYAKGAAALRQLNAYLGDDDFIQGVTNYLHEHAYGNASLDDLLRSWQAVSGKDVDSWSRVWLRTEGIDTLAVRVTPDHGPVIERTNGSPIEVSRPHAVTVTSYADGRAPASERVVITEDRTPVHLETDRSLLLPDSADQSWAKLHLDDSSVEAAPDLLRTIPDPVSRAVFWGALRESMLDAELDPAILVDILVAALPHEPSDMIIERVLGTGGGYGATSHVGTYLNLDDHRARLAELAQILLDESAPGSNRQLVASRAVVSLTREETVLKAWLGAQAPSGLRVDAEFRWRLLRALCSMGAAGIEAIEAERRLDPSSQGAIFALGCQARLPDAAAKARVWGRITTEAELTNYQLYELCRHFFGPTDSDVTASYVARYFEEMPRTAALRSGWVVETSTQLAFPLHSATVDTLDLAVTRLLDDDLTVGVRRAIADRTDDLRRVVASRQKFGA